MSDFAAFLVAVGISIFAFAFLIVAGCFALKGWWMIKDRRERK